MFVYLCWPLVAFYACIKANFVMFMQFASSVYFVAC